MKVMTMTLVLVACLAGAALAQPAVFPQPVFDDRAKISVTGEAVVYAKPDKIVISLGIETVDKDILLAKQKNNEIMKKTIAVVKGAGVLEKDIQTDQLTIEPRWRSEYRQEEFIGFFVRNTLAVTLNDATKVEGVITSALQSGVNYIYGVDFQTSQFKELRDQARELALKAAQEKAEKMAEVLDQTVDIPVQITENYSGSSYPGMSRGGGQFNAMAQNFVQDMRGDVGEASDTIALGKIAIRASVAVTFTLE